MRMLNGLFRRLGLALAGVALMCAPAWSIDYYLQAERFLMTMPDGTSAPMWGYAQYSDNTFTTLVKPASVPGPLLEVPAGDLSGLTIHLKNNLPTLNGQPVPTSIVIPAQPAALAPATFTDAQGRTRVRSFTTETAPGTVGIYSWPTLKPGTYLYESGTHPQVQIQMGLYGAVVRDSASAPLEAYPAIPYTAHHVLLFSEVDPTLHAAVDNNTYGTPPITSTINYVPKYFLVNGAAYGQTTAQIDAGQTGDRVLLRLLNAGLESHVPTLLGAYFQLVAEDGSPLPYPKEQYAAHLAAGKTLDAIWTPATDGVYPIYDRRLRQGMLAQLAVGTNRPPVITSAPVTTATVGIAYSYQVLATDPNAGDVLTYSLTTAPTGMTISVTGLIGWTPTAAQVGPQAMTVRVQDQGGLFVTQSFTVTVAAANIAPAITSTPILTAAAGTAYSYQVVATDPNVGDVLTYSLTTAPTGMTISATGLIGWTPTAAQAGPQAVTVRVQDQGGLFTTQSFTVTVAAAGPAVVSITLRNATAAGDPIIVQPLVNGADLNLSALCGGCQVNFQAVTSPATITGGSVRLVLTGATAQARNDNTNPYTLPANPGGNYAGITLNPGSHTLTATPYSGTNATGTPGTPLTITFTVGAANVAPAITSTAITTAVATYPYSYQVAATDPNAGDTLTYSLTAAPAGMTISGTGLISWTPTAAQVSPPQPLVTVRVQDQGGLFATQSFNIAVAANQAPAITSTIPPTTATVGVAYSYQVVATDPNAGTTLTYSLTTAPAGMTISATGLISWTPTAAQVGPQAVTVRVQDQGGLFATQSFTVTVAGTPPPLPAGLVAAYAFNEGTGTTVADATGRGHTGTFVGATWTPSGRYGAALVFNGTNARVTVPDAADLDLTTGVTLEAWVYPTAAGGGAWRTVITKDNAANISYLLYANTDTNNPGMFVGGTWQQQVVGGSTLAANVWTHLAGTYDGATIRLYVNGVQVASRAQTAPIATNNDLLSIGGSSVWGEWFAGRLDELRIYNRALTAAEIQADSAAPLP